MNIFEEAVKYYRAYIERNDSLESFAYDVNTLGGTFENDCWINTNKKESIISDKNSNIIKKIPLVDLYDYVKGNKLI